MSAAQLLLQEARAELRAGLRSGIVGLVFVGLAGYLLMCLTNADYVQQMGGTDIARNAPSLIYLMSTGCMFFLFFAWAWVFAQPLLRDRQADLHEVVLSLPICLPALLWGRFIGAALVSALLASALIVGFIAAPVLGWLGLVPAGSIAALPWRALLFAWGWLLLPAGTGIGALYYLITLRTRSVAGAFGLSALLMLLWMFAVVVLKGGDINPLLAAVLDPSLFTFAHTRIEAWTPLQKSTALLPMTPGFLLNRAVWGVLPLALLAWALHGVRRESLVLEKAAPRAAVPAVAITRTPAVRRSLAPVAASHWRIALWLETRWQLHQLARSRGWWAGMSVLAAMCVLSAFVHGIWHADGPLLPRPDLLLPLLKDATYLVIAFLIAALVGWVSRRDQVDGFDSMFDALPAPIWLRPFARALAVIATTVLLSLLPGAAAVLVTALALPAALDLGDALLYQLLVMAPPLLELGLLSFVVHALCRRAGVAYSVSMLLTFILVVNHELGMADYPLYQVGIPVHLQLSGLTGWALARVSARPGRLQAGAGRPVGRRCGAGAATRCRQPTAPARRAARQALARTGGRARQRGAARPAGAGHAAECTTDRPWRLSAVGADPARGRRLGTALAGRRRCLHRRRRRPAPAARSSRRTPAGRMDAARRACR